MHLSFGFPGFDFSLTLHWGWPLGLFTFFVICGVVNFIVEYKKEKDAEKRMREVKAAMSNN